MTAPLVRELVALLVLLFSLGIAWGSLSGRVSSLLRRVEKIEAAPTVPEVIQVELRYIGERLDRIENAITARGAAP